MIAALTVFAGGMDLTFSAYPVQAQSEERTSFDDQFDKWLDDLGSSHPKLRRPAYDKLRQTPDWRLTLPRTIRVLRAATRRFPPLLGDDSQAEIDDDIHGGTSTLLVNLVAERARPEHIAIVAECFPKYSLPARSEAMRLLASLKSQASAAAVMKLVREYAPRKELPALYLGYWGETPEFADVFFPEILRFATEPTLEDEALCLLELYADLPDMSIDILERCGPDVLAHYHQHEKGMGRILRFGPDRAIYGQDYEPHRDPICQLLGLLAACPTNEGHDELTRAIGFHDPRVKLSAALGLLRIGEAVSTPVWEEIAASGETRISLFEALSQREQLDLFPDKYLTQAALAESDLVRWLVGNSDAGHPPAKIELAKVVTIDPRTEEGVLDYYVFQFCMELPQNGDAPEWKAGVSGPYARHEQPTADAQDEPRSEFEPMDAKWPEEHVGNLGEIIQEYRWQAGIEQ